MTARDGDGRSIEALDAELSGIIDNRRWRERVRARARVRHPQGGRVITYMPDAEDDRVPAMLSPGEQYYIIDHGTDHEQVIPARALDFRAGDVLRFRSEGVLDPDAAEEFVHSLTDRHVTITGRFDESMRSFFDVPAFGGYQPGPRVRNSAYGGYGDGITAAELDEFHRHDYAWHSVSCVCNVCLMRDALVETIDHREFKVVFRDEEA